jgi:hypothetical protein
MWDALIGGTVKYNPIIPARDGRRYGRLHYKPDPFEVPVNQRHREPHYIEVATINAIDEL